jgi:hypothetical protein
MILVIAFARKAEGLRVPSQPWMLAKAENSLLQRQKAPKLQRWQLLCALTYASRLHSQDATRHTATALSG